MSCYNEYLALIRTENIDLDTWLSAVIGCAEIQGPENALDSISRAVQDSNIPSARQVYRMLVLAFTARESVTNERKFTLNPLNKIIDRKVKKDVESVLYVAGLILQAFNHGLEEAQKTPTLNSIPQNQWRGMRVYSPDRESIGTVLGTAQGLASDTWLVEVLFDDPSANYCMYYQDRLVDVQPVQLTPKRLFPV